jgi:hypothetical protein
VRVVARCPPMGYIERMPRARIHRHALRALIAALLLWAAPATPVSAAPLAEAPAWVVAQRAAAPHPGPRAVVPAVVRVATTAEPEPASVRVERRPVSLAFVPHSPRYLLNCALLR